MSGESIRIFEDVVINSVSTFLAPLGFRLKKNMDRIFFAESDRVQVRIIYGRTAIIIEVVPISKADDPDNSIELWNILEAYKPNMDESEWYPQPLHNAQDIRSEVERQLCMLVSCCDSLLKGDPKAWAIVDAWYEDMGGLWQRGNETKEQYINRLRNMVSVAWETKHYWRVSQIYSQLSNFSRLKLRDRLRCFSASRHTFLIG